jgi:GT2 family glycosyltransferase
MMAKQLPKIFIIVLNWNGWRDTIECLESVFQNSYQNYQVVVLDNGSSDSSIDKIKEWAEGKIKVESQLVAYNANNKPIRYVEYDNITAQKGGIPEKENQYLLFKEDHAVYPLVLVQNGANLGFAGGNNVGIRYVMAQNKGEYVWLLNNDTVIKRDSLEYLVNNAQNEKRIGVVGSTVLYYDKPNIVQVWGGGAIIPWMGIVRPLGENKHHEEHDKNEVTPDYICGVSFLVRAEVIKKIGLMDERYFLYWEDTDWCERIKQKGWKLTYEPKSIIYHKTSASLGYQSKDQDYYLTRNAVVFMQKYYWQFLPLSLLISTGGKIVNRIRRKQFNRIGLILRATLDGLMSSEQ